jgi:DHA3 family macrolide efflux protein-like MFS transporter
MMITIWDIEYVLIFDVAGALLAVTSLFFVHIPNPEQLKDLERNIFKEMKEGAMVVLRNKGLSLVFLYSILIWFFIVPISVLFPLMTLDYFNGSEFQAGIIEAIWSVGALVGGAIMGAKVYKVNRVGLINWMYIFLGIAFLLSGLLSPTGFVWFAILTGLSGIYGSVYNSAFTGLLQTKIDASALGRVFSMYYTIALIPAMLGLIGIGFVADVIGLNTSFSISGVIIIIIGIIAFFTKTSMKIDNSRTLSQHL